MEAPEERIQEPAFMEKIRADPKRYESTGTVMELPLFSDPDIRKAMGYKGKSFSRSIVHDLFWDNQEQMLVGSVYFNNGCEGPMGSVHGGALATSLDSCLGWTTVRALGLGHVTLNLNVNYRKFMKLGDFAKVECKVVKTDDRKVYLEGKLLAVDETTVHCECTAIFYRSTSNVFSFDQVLTSDRISSVRCELHSELNQR
eukprot:TRINITY_DN22009_c0_g1_i3.p1 TRINITY_DN22009_c0_g1~~TRINITY_DN22009_c0_g1_i3.p1  ORF type:complete len:200 (+),score=44.99 TRINITY_DN22009_c0_g1_i3:79-678(+)